MKKIFSSRHLLTLTVVVASFGCQKQEFKDPSLFSHATASTIGDANRTGCRLTSFDYYVGINDDHQIDQFTYKNGLVDEWSTYWGGVFKMEYNEKGKLIRSVVYVEGDLEGTIEFFYEKDKVVHEIWYNGNTSNVADEVFYEFNSKGEMIEIQATVSDYRTVNTYDDNGNLTSWFVYFGGTPAIKAEYTYTKQIKNPYNTPGIEYAFPYVNAAFGTGISWYSSEKMTLFDENGIPNIYFDLDPSLTQWQFGYQKLPYLAGYIDKQSGVFFSVGFTMENCGQENSAGPNSIKQRSATTKTELLNPGSFRAMTAGPRSGLKQRLVEFRKQFRK